MEFFQTVNDRRSIRVYEKRTVEEEKLKQVLEAANRAPSAGNLQAYEIVVVRDAQCRQRLAELCFKQMFMSDAPIHLIFLTAPARNREKYGELSRFFALQDATAAVTQAHLAAAAVGLGGCWIGGYDENAVRAMVGATPEMQVAAILPIGYAAEAPAPRDRRPLSDLAHEAKL